MKLVTLVKITLNHLPNKNIRDPVVVLKTVTNANQETLHQLVVNAANENGENRSLDDLSLKNKELNLINFDISFDSRKCSSVPYAKCEITPSALEIEGRYFKLDEIIA